MVKILQLQKNSSLFSDEVLKAALKRLDDKPFISFSQNGEDVILNRLFKNKKNGFYVDIGAYHPVIKSTSYFAYLRGWNGINIDVCDENIKRFSKIRPRDININAAIGLPGQNKTFYMLPGTTRSTIDKALSLKYQRRGFKIEEKVLITQSLGQIYSLKKHPTIDFLNLDVEGSEKNVIEGIDFQYIKPKVIVIEATYPEQEIISSEGWEEILFKNDYQQIFFDGLNKYFCAQGFAKNIEFPVLPKNYFDNYISFMEYILLQDRINSK